MVILLLNAVLVLNVILLLNGDVMDILVIVLN